jgi:zinc protease
MVSLTQPPSTRLNNPTIRRLANGLTLIAEQIPVESVTLDIWARVGSAIETDEINGMAHFLEHMIFKGTDRLACGEYERRVEERGAVMNAATSQDYTHYYITCAPKDFADLAPLQLDLVFNPRIPDADFEQERHVVLEEIRRSEDDTRRRSYRRSVETVFERLPYRRAVLGPAAVVEQLKPQQMRDFHRTWYQPEALTIVTVGNLPVEELLDTVCDNLPSHLLPQVSTAHLSEALGAPEPAFETIVRRDYVDPKLQQSRLMLAWRVPGLRDIADTYALDVAASVLSSGRTSRLVQDLREQRSLVNSVSASNSNFLAQGMFSISARLDAEQIEPVEAAILDHIRRMQQELITPAELQRIRTQVANRYIFANERPSDRANLYGYYQTLMGDLEPAFNYVEILKAITPEDVRDAVKRYLNPEAYAAIVQRPG